MSYKIIMEYIYNIRESFLEKWGKMTICKNPEKIYVRVYKSAYKSSFLRAFNELERAGVDDEEAVTRASAVAHLDARKSATEVAIKFLEHQEKYKPTKP